jgi:outer membrane protein assembly factor BamB
MRFLLPLLLPTVLFAEAANWPQWRGPGRDGKADGKAWPATLQGGALQQIWRVELGPGYSGPIVFGDRVFVTETAGKKMEVVRALDRKTGKELWRHEWEGSMSVPFFAKSNGDWIRATPAYSEGRLFVAGMRDVLVCLDAETGKEQWRFDFPAKLKSALPAFGFASSPLVEGDAVYVQAGGGFCRLKAKTGELVWRSLVDDGGMMGSAFSSPVFATLGGQRQLVVQTREKLAGVNPADGAVLWEQPVPAFRGMNILTPTVTGDLVFTSTYGGKTTAFRVTHGDGKWSVERAWEFKAQGYMTSPVIVKDTAYLHLRSQRAMAIDVPTGAERWTSGESFGKYWSLVANGDRLLALDERGMLYLLRATPEKFDKLDERKVSAAETWAHLAVCGDELFIRELNAITAWRWKAAK